MRKEILFSILVLTLLNFSYIALATGSISITTVTIPTSVTQGDTFTVTMSVSGSTVTDVKGSLTLPSGLTCTPSGTQTISLSASGTGSASWSCTASVAGDYSNQITASVSATDSGTGSGLSDSEQTGLRVLTPASLTASSTLSASSVAVSGTVTFTVGVNNVGDSSTTFNISCSASPCSCGSVANTAVSGDSLVNSQITVTASSSAGTCTVTATVKSPVQSDITTSQTLTVTASSGDTTSTTGGGGTAAAVEFTKTIATASPTQPAVATIESLKAKTLKVDEVTIDVKESVNNVKVTVKESSLPAGATIAISTDSGATYKYLDITTSVANEKIDKVTIKFKVEKSWITNKTIASSTISLQRYANNQWNKLTTTKLSEDDTYIYYEAESPGLSVFTITGEKKSAVTQECPFDCCSGEVDYNDKSCASGYECKDRKCVVTAPKKCPTCAECTEWGECVDKEQTRTCYKCSADTNYKCQAYPETKSCEKKADNLSLYIGIGIVAGLILIIVLVSVLRKKPAKRNGN